jgi:hypothetical protein
MNAAIREKSRREKPGLGELIGTPFSLPTAISADGEKLALPTEGLRLRLQLNARGNRQLADVSIDFLYGSHHFLLCFPEVIEYNKARSPCRLALSP